MLDVFVMISHPAGCPNASLEAMSAGLPIIATDYGGASEQVDATIGELVPDGDVERTGGSDAEDCRVVRRGGRTAVLRRGTELRRDSVCP